MRKLMCASARSGGIFVSALGLLALVMATLAVSALAREPTSPTMAATR